MHSMREARRATWAAGAVAVALVATACGGGADEGGGGAGSGGVVSASWGDPQNPLEPANTNEVQGGKVLELIFRGLKRYDPKTSRPENLLADKITTPDAQTFTITVKKGWTFSNGEPVTAKSFVDAWNYAALVDHGQTNAPFFKDIDGYDQVHPESGKATAKALTGLRVTGERTFTVRLKQKFSTWPDILGYPAFAPLPRAFFTDHAGWLKKPIGDGPYTISSYTKGQVLKARRWDGYPGPDKARNDGVDLRVYTSNGTAYTDLQAGNLDLVDDIPAAQLKTVKQDLGDRYLNQPAGIIQTIAFPFYDKKWASPNAAKVRRGLSMAINRAQITRQIFQNTRKPASDWTAPVLGKVGGYRQGLCGDACTYDPKAAKKLIDEAGGIPGGKLTINYNADAGSHKDWVDAVCNSIDNALHDDHACVGKPVGTFADFRNQIAGRTISAPYRSGWQMDYPLIQDFLQPLYYTGASSNDQGYSNKTFDRLVDQANAESDPAKSVSTFQNAEKILAEQVPSIPLWYQNGTGGYSERLSHVALDGFGFPVYEQITVG